MRSKMAAGFALIAVGVCLGLSGAGCNKTPPPVNQVELALKLPGATNVFAAVAQKDYEGAIAAWAKLRDPAADQERQAQFAALTGELRNRLSEAGSTDPKAAEAFNALRAVMTGR